MTPATCPEACCRRGNTQPREGKELLPSTGFFRQKSPEGKAQFSNFHRAESLGPRITDLRLPKSLVVPNRRVPSGHAVDRGYVTASGRRILGPSCLPVLIDQFGSSIDRSAPVTDLGPL